MSAPVPARLLEALTTHVREHLFTPSATASALGRRVGAEVELIPLHSGTGCVCALEEDEGDAPSLLRFLRGYGARHQWVEHHSAKGVPLFRLPDGGALTFEPGGQIECSTAPCRSASTLIEQLQGTVLPLRAAAQDQGIELVSLGIDPHNPVDRAPLQVRVERYCRMADYFATLGAAGARMMRQTAAVQINLDVEDELLLRWRVLNSAAPYLVAIFANSPLYGGVPTGHLSYRAHTWRELDPRRTGVIDGDGDAVARYVEFALRAPAVMVEPDDGEYLPFGEWMSRADLNEADWRVHLSTLFPEVRPRSYLEVRSADAIAPEWYAAPIALLSGITYHRPSTRAAAEVLGAGSSCSPAELLARAGTFGLRDPSIARVAAELVDVALAGCVALGGAFLRPAHLAIAQEFCDRYVRRGLAPADGVLADAAVAGDSFPGTAAARCK